MTKKEEILEKALRTIVEWKDFPNTGYFWDAEKTIPMTYSSSYGSNGERDYMRNIARIALELSAHNDNKNDNEDKN